MTTTTSPRYGLYIGSSATGQRYISRAHLTRAMRLDPSIASMPIHEVRRDGTRIDHKRASDLDASNNHAVIAPDADIDG